MHRAAGLDLNVKASSTCRHCDNALIVGWGWRRRNVRHRTSAAYSLLACHTLHNSLAILPGKGNPSRHPATQFSAATPWRRFLVGSKTGGHRESQPQIPLAVTLFRRCITRERSHRPFENRRRKRGVRRARRRTSYVQKRRCGTTSRDRCSVFTSLSRDTHERD